MMLFKQFRYLSILFLLLTASLFSEPLVLSDASLLESVYLDEGWIFSTDGTSDYSSGVEKNKDWFDFSGQGPWQFLLPEVQDHHDFSWYSIDFLLDETVSDDPIALSFYNQYSSIELFLNGEKLYESKNWDDSTPLTIGEDSVVLLLPRKSLNFNSKNTISIKSGSYSGWGGAVLFKIGYFHQVARDVSLRSIRNIGISFISLFIFLYFLFQYILQRKEVYSLYISLCGLAIASFILGYYGHFYTIFNSAWSYWLMTFIGGIFMYLLPILFVHSFYKLKPGIIAKSFIALYSLLALFVLIEFLLTGQIKNFVRYAYNPFNMTYILVVPYMLYLGIKALVRKMEYSKVMFIGISLLTLSFVSSMFSFASIIHVEPLIGEGFFAMVLAFSFVLAKRYKQAHNNLEIAHGQLIKASNEIRELNDSLEVKVESRTKELREKNLQITESIEYAGRIQQSLLPTEESLSQVFSRYFVIWRPKDVVGGDIYWLYPHDEGFLFAVIDCTGHGIPGALLTMSVSSSLDHIADQMGMRDPALILSKLNGIMKNQLNQGVSSPYSDDGLEIGLVSYEKGSGELLYAGSKIRLIARNIGEISEYKGNIQGLGFKRTKANQQYDLQKIPFDSETQFYLASDGIIEQTGGLKGFGFGWKRFKGALEESGSFPNQVKATLMETFSRYKGATEQRDDILVAGFSIDSMTDD